MAKILILAGDGIGPEITSEAEKILRYVGEQQQFDLEFEHALLGGIAVDKTGEPYPQETREKARQADAVLLGAVGGPRWDTLPREKRPEKGLLAIRKDLNLYANLRPACVHSALIDASPLKAEAVRDLDILIVRELTGDIYFGEPRGIQIENGERIGRNTMIYSESEIRRIAHVAFRIAQQRQKKLCSVDKMNVLETTQLWRDVVNETAPEYPDVNVTHLLVDNAAMQLIRYPKQFDVILTGNIFGDILSDEASMLSGSIGMLPSASLGEGGKGLYEPIHGSAPDIAGKNQANPLATILSAAMLLRHSLAQEQAARLIEQAVENVLENGGRTADIAQKGEAILTTSAMGDAVLEMIKRNL